MKSLILLLALLMLGCSGESIVGIQSSDDSPDAEIRAVAARDAVYVPIRGRETYVADLSEFRICGVAPDGTPAVFPAVFYAEGVFTHLGTTTSVITVDECALDPDSGEVYFTGGAVHTAARGDELHVTYEGDAYLDGTIVFDVITFVGGTGRFENVTGSATGRGMNYPDGTGYFSIRGMISSVGSLP